MSSDFTEKQSSYCERHKTLQYPSLGTLAGHLRITISEFKGKLYKFTRHVLGAGHFF